MCVVLFIYFRAYCLWSLNNINAIYMSSFYTRNNSVDVACPSACTILQPTQLFKQSYFPPFFWKKKYIYIISFSLAVCILLHLCSLILSISSIKDPIPMSTVPVFFFALILVPSYFILFQSNPVRWFGICVFYIESTHTVELNWFIFGIT